MWILCGVSKGVVITLRDFRMVPSTYSNYGPNVNLRSIRVGVFRKRLVNHVCILLDEKQHYCMCKQNRSFFLIEKKKVLQEFLCKFFCHSKVSQCFLLNLWYDHRGIKK